MDNHIISFLQNFEKPVRRIVNIHYKDYRYLLPDTINKFNTKKRFRYNNSSYDLYGWVDNAIVDIYPTYKNIITINKTIDNPDKP